MLFVYALIISIASAALILGVTVVLRVIRKQDLMPKDTALSLSFDAGVNYLLDIVILAFVYGLFERHSDWNVSAGLIAAAIVVFAIRPHRFIWSLLHREEGAPKKHRNLLIQLGILFACLLSETLIFNAANYGGPESAEDAYTSSMFSKTTGEAQEDGTIVLGNGRYVILPSVSFAEISNIYIDSAYQNCEMTASVDYKNGTKWTNIVSKTINPAYESDRTLKFVAPAGVSEGELRVVFFFPSNRAGYPTSIKLNSIKTNVGNLFSFSLLRFIALVALTEGLTVILFHKKREDVDELTPENTVKRFVIGSSIVCGAIMAAFLIMAFTLKDMFFTVYPFTEAELGTNFPASGSTNPFIYYNLFDAFMKGQVHLDVVPDPVLETIDPYSPAARRTAGAYFLWDTVYYGGKYFVYFGASPVILVMFPIYWITHLVPNGIFIQLFGCILYAYGFCLLGAAGYKAFGKNLRVRQLVTLVVMVLLGSLFLELVSWRTTDWKYMIPYIYSIGSAAYFVAFTLFAYASEKRRILNLAAAGLFFVIIVASRATMAVIVLPCIPLYIKMLVRGEKKLSKRFIDFAPMAGILIAGAIVLCAYNYVRFGSITDFGSAYQLTIADCRKFHLNGVAFLAGFDYYYLPFPTFDSIFPYVDVGLSDYGLENIHPYNVGTVGLFASPILWVSIAAPAFLTKSDGWEKKAFYIAGLFPPYILSVVCSAYAGFCIRYATEIFGAAGIIALLGAILGASRFKEGKKPAKAYWTFLLAAGVFSAFINVSLMTNSFSPLKSGDLFGFRVWIEQMFNGVVK
ncbi:MAG: hypothetical protein K6F32_01875 [Bacilli bacterium]|nr:hypothetical protein [Bacilli bacterium]